MVEFKGIHGGVEIQEVLGERQELKGKMEEFKGKMDQWKNWSLRERWMSGKIGVYGKVQGEER